MAFVLIDNLPPFTTEVEVRALLAEQQADAPLTLQLAPGLGERVAATCEWDDAAYAEAVAGQLHDHNWQGRALTAIFLPAAQG